MTTMRNRIFQAIAAALIAGALLLAGTAPYGQPGTRTFVATDISVSGK